MWGANGDVDSMNYDRSGQWTDSHFQCINRTADDCLIAVTRSIFCLVAWSALIQLQAGEFRNIQFHRESMEMVTQFVWGKVESSLEKLNNFDCNDFNSERPKIGSQIWQVQKMKGIQITARGVN